MLHNPDPKKYAVHKRFGGKYVLVDRQVLKWRRERWQRQKEEKARQDALAGPQILNPFA